MNTERGWFRYNPNSILRLLSKDWSWKPSEDYEEGIYVDGNYEEYILDEYGRNLIPLKQEN